MDGQASIALRPGLILRALVFVLVLVGVRWVPMAAGAAQVSPASQPSPAFQDFTQRVQEYLKLRKELQGSVPRRKNTKLRKEIVERQVALAQKIREARSNAKQGDIFTPEISEQFRQTIGSKLHGASASNVRKTIRQGEPLQDVSLSVNAAYPDRLPRTTVPPTLLLSLPQLPQEVAYRIVGHFFVLEDIEARVVIDFIPAAIP
jgi:hypothetical protein